MWWIGSDIGDMRNIWKEKQSVTFLLRCNALMIHESWSMTHGSWQKFLIAPAIFEKFHYDISTTAFNMMTFSFPKIVLTLAYLVPFEIFSLFKFSLWNLLSKATIQTNVTHPVFEYLLRVTSVFSQRVFGTYEEPSLSNIRRQNCVTKHHCLT